MTITASAVVWDRPQRDGRRSVLYRYVDHVGEVHIVGPLLIGSDVDAAADCEALAPIMAARLADTEIGLLIAAVEAGTLDPQDVILTHATKQAFVRQLFRYVMRQNSAKLVLRLERLRDWLKANYTAGQIATYLGVTLAQLAAVNNRIDALVAIKATLNADAPVEIA